MTRPTGGIRALGWRETRCCPPNSAGKLRTGEKVRDWLELPDADLETYLADLARPRLLTAGGLEASGAVPDDADDDKVLAAAQESGAEYIVSEDRDLGKLKEWQGAKIMNRDQFLAELDRLGVP